MTSNMDSHTRQVLIALQSKYEQSKKARAKCSCPDCNADAVFSHVFSRKHILQPICPENKIYLFEPRDFISIPKDDMLHYHLRGLKQAFGFYGFCQYHDNNVFVEIEPSKGYVDWSDIRMQYLLSYRSLCREVYANRTIYDGLRFLFEHTGSNKPDYHFDLQYLLLNMDAAFSNLLQYKSFLERGVFDNTYSDIRFHCVELPYQLDLCISAPITVDDGRGPCFKFNYQELNMVNVFPYYGKTIILIGYSPNFDNRWMQKILPGFLSSDPHIVSSTFTDIMYRAELNAISPKTFAKLNSDLLKAYYITFQEKGTDYSIDMTMGCVSDLFYNPLMEIMPEYKKVLSRYMPKWLTHIIAKTTKK